MGRLLYVSKDDERALILGWRKAKFVYFRLLIFLFLIDGLKREREKKEED